MHTEEDALKKKTFTYDFFPVGESRLYWYIEMIKEKQKVERNTMITLYNSLTVEKKST